MSDLSRRSLLGALSTAPAILLLDRTGIDPVVLDPTGTRVLLPGDDARRVLLNLDAALEVAQRRAVEWGRRWSDLKPTGWTPAHAALPVPVAGYRFIGRHPDPAKAGDLGFRWWREQHTDRWLLSTGTEAPDSLRDDELARGWCECFYGSRDANTDLHDAVNAWLSAFAQAAPTDAATVIVHVRWRIHVLARGDYPPWQFLALDDGAGRVVEAFVEEGA